MENTNVKWDAWGIECSFFDADILGKEQALFALGNGYMGVRSAVEEEYPQPPGTPAYSDIPSCLVHLIKIQSPINLRNFRMQWIFSPWTSDSTESH